VRPTDEQLAHWHADEYASFPEYYETDHYALLEGMISELVESRATIARVKSLADEWETNAGPDSRAWEVYGPQNVSVPFAVKSIRDAIKGGE
jgi:hypothetical protein